MRYTCWGIHPVQAAGRASAAWAAGWALGVQEPEPKARTDDSLPNKGHRDLWHSKTWEELMTPEFCSLRLWGYKCPGCLCLESLLRGNQLKLLFCYSVIVPRLNNFKDLDVWDSALGNLLWLCKCRVCGWGGDLAPAQVMQEWLPKGLLDGLQGSNIPL